MRMPLAAVSLFGKLLALLVADRTGAGPSDATGDPADLERLVEGLATRAPDTNPPAGANHSESGGQTASHEARR